MHKAKMWGAALTAILMASSLFAAEVTETVKPELTAEQIARAARVADFQAAYKECSEVSDFVALASEYKDVYGSIEQCMKASLTFAKAGDPRCLPLAFAWWRTCPATILEEVTKRVAACIKAVDGNITRANQWVEGLADGRKDSPVFTLAETKLPDFLVDEKSSKNALLMGDGEVALARALGLYNAAIDEKALNRAIEDVAKALRAIDLNLKRANEWIQAQKEGKSYDFTPKNTD